MKGPLDVTQKTLCVPFMVVKFAFGLPSTPLNFFPLILHTCFVAFSWWYIQLPLGSLHTVCMCLVFSVEKKTVRRIVQPMDTWRQGNCSKGRSSNSGLDSETQIRQRRKLPRKAVKEKAPFLWNLPLYKRQMNSMGLNNALCPKKHEWILVSKTLSRLQFLKI